MSWRQTIPEILFQKISPCFSNAPISQSDDLDTATKSLLHKFALVMELYSRKATKVEIPDRIEREFVLVLKMMYTSKIWWAIILTTHVQILVFS